MQEIIDKVSDGQAQHEEEEEEEYGEEEEEYGEWTRLLLLIISAE